MKKIISLVLVFALAMSFTLVPSLAEGVITPVPSESMDLMDAAIAGYFFAGDINEREENVNASGYVGITNIVPLYDTENTVVAYYITYSTGVYAVINNNPENPEAIEFGAGTQHYIVDAFRTAIPTWMNATMYLRHRCKALRRRSLYPMYQLWEMVTMDL